MKSVHEKDRSVSARFWPKIRKSTDCWNWTGALNRQGKGIIRNDTGINVEADRKAYEFATGKWPEGSLIHLCGNPACVRIHPDHVVIATKKNRFWSKVKKTARCWLWTGHIVWNGYGVVNKKPTGLYRAHWVAYEYLHGPVPKGMELYHRCKNRHCIRIHPDHVVLGTHAERTQNSIELGWIRAGERHGMAKLTWKEVRDIRRRHSRGEGMAVLAKDHSVSWSTVYRIIKRMNWKE